MARSRLPVDVSRNPLGIHPPTLFTAMSKRPKRSAAVCARLATASVSDKSVTTTSAVRPRARICSATASRSARVLAAMTISAPASARANAEAAPSPRPAPVTTATLPSSRNRSRITESPEAGARCRHRFELVVPGRHASQRQGATEELLEQRLLPLEHPLLELAVPTAGCDKLDSVGSDFRIDREHE